MAAVDIKKQVALAVRSIQWSYAIFWSISPRRPGVLQWGEGYYNGDIKTRKTIHSSELNVDPLGLQRSEQLRELFETLAAGEASPLAKRPSAALSPEDLTDTEWYYLVCMSFMFNIGEGLPGRSLANSQPIWLCNAHYADSRVFSRSLLAKSAMIQTVVCFPFAGGVIELGVTEPVSEDCSMIQHIKTSFLEVPYPLVVEKSRTRSDGGIVCTTYKHGIHEMDMIPVVQCGEKPKNSSNNKQAEDSYILDETNGRGSQEQSWQFMEDDLSHCVPFSVNSSDCMSQSIEEPVERFPSPNGKMLHSNPLQDVGKGNHKKLTELDIQGGDMHYQSVLSSLLKRSNPLISGRCSKNGQNGSSFLTWKKGGLVQTHNSKAGTRQKLLKRILLEVPQMHTNGLLKSPKHNADGVGVGVWRPEADDVAASNAVSKRMRRERIHERLLALKSLLPTIIEVDRVCILDETIEYLQDLERRIEELESCQELTGLDTMTRRRCRDAVERTSDNYGCDKTTNGKRALAKKRKACDIDETTPYEELQAPKDGSTASVTINTNEKEAQIDIKCFWREGILLEVMDAISHLHLDSQSVQSATSDGILKLTIKTKFKGSTCPSVGAIKQALQIVARKC